MVAPVHLNEELEEKPESKPASSKFPLEPDAIVSDSTLRLLRQPIERHRTFSDGTKIQIDAQKHQIQFGIHRQQLETTLMHVVHYLESIVALNRKTSIRMPSDLQILQVDLRLGPSSMVGSPPPASLVESRLLQVIRHTQKLQARLRDTTSRVLITGDLNSGKSSLCNSLLRRKILPVDQQPCTNVFCEVIDSRKNNGIEEVHAVPLKYNYDQQDSSTYEVFSVVQLKELVHLSDKYKLLVVYMRDPRVPGESLLANGVVDICLIDAPGLNVSAVTTTELFGRQEEIDLVIFVVSAENHFTQSAKEFVSDTAREKSLLFIAVNNFDRIQDKERCKDQVLKQIAALAPETYKGASEFVHFVSSEPLLSPAASPAPLPSPSDSPSSSPSDSPDRCDLDRLEMSLRNFVLEKRSASKLAPARTFLINILEDLMTLAKHNQQFASREKQQLVTQLQELAPSIDSSVKEYAQISDQIERDTERLCAKLLSQSEQFLGYAVNGIGESTGVEWRGLANVFEYIRETRETLVQRVLSAVSECEDEARALTGSAVDSIKQLGVLHVGNQPAFAKVFNSSAMFSRKRDNLSRLITANFSFMDVFDIGYLLERPLPVLNSSKQALVSAAAANASISSALGGAVTALSIYQGALGTGPSVLAASIRKLTGLVGFKNIILPAAALSMFVIGAYIVHELPRTIPRKIARKIAYEIDDLGYVRSNAERIAAECRKVLRYPAQDVRSAFQSQLESRTRKQEEYECNLKESEYVISVFSELSEQAEVAIEDVRRIHL